MYYFFRGTIYSCLAGTARNQGTFTLMALWSVQSFMSITVGHPPTPHACQRSLWMSPKLSSPESPFDLLNARATKTNELKQWFARNSDEFRVILG